MLAFADRERERETMLAFDGKERERHNVSL